MQQKIGVSNSVNFERLYTSRVRSLSVCTVCTESGGKAGFEDEKVIKRKAS